MRFTVHRRGHCPASPCGHRPSGGDVPGRVHVRVAAVSAGDAPESRLALAGLRCEMSARRALLRRVRGVDLLHPSRSLLPQAGHQQTPSVCQDAAVEAGFLPDPSTRFVDSSLGRPSHAPDSEIFDPDHVEFAREGGRRLLDPVLAAVHQACVQPGERDPHALTSSGARSAPAQPSLQRDQSLLFVLGQARTPEEVSGRKRGRHHHTAIHSNRRTVPRCRNRLRRRGECDVPASCTIAGNPVGLDPVGYLTAPAKPNPSHFGHPDPAVSAIQPLDVPLLYGDLTKPFVTAGLPPSRTTMCAVEEVPYGLVKVAQRLLLHRMRPGTKPREFATRFGQLTGLVVVRSRGAPRTPVRVLLDREVPHEARVRAVLQKQSFLF